MLGDDNWVGPEESDEMRKVRVQQARAERIRMDTLNLARDTPIREDFHTFMYSQGYVHRMRETPALGHSYNSSFIEQMWQAFLFATLNERAKHHDK